MKVIITETTAVASAIARALNVNKTAKSTAVPGVIKDSKTAVIAIEQNLLTPYGVGVLPGKDALPIIPERYTYGIRLTPYASGRRRVSEEDQAYADYIGGIIREGDEVVFASDGGADAQGRFANICRFFKVGTPTSRMWVTRLEKKHIKKAFEKRQRGRSLHNLAQTGLVGMAMNEAFRYNVTEAYRAMFPSMTADICRQDMLLIAAAKDYLDRDREVRAAHKSVTTHSVMISGEVMGNIVKFYPAETFASKEEANEAYKALAVPATVSSSYTGIENEEHDAPALYILATLQCDAWEKFSFPFAKTREIADSLYQKGLISSPRTYNAKLPKSMRDYILKRYRWAKGYPFADDAEVPTTHGIITTESKPFRLDEGSQVIYDLIKNRFEANIDGKTMTSELAVCFELGGLFFTGTMPWQCCDEVPSEPLEIKLIGKSVFTHKTAAPEPAKMHDLLGAMSLVLRSLSVRYNPGIPFSADSHDVTDAFDRLRANYFIIDACGEPVISADGKKLLETFDQTYALENLLTDIVETDRIYGNYHASKGGKRLMEEFGKRIYEKTEQLILDDRLFSTRPETHVCPICGRHSVVRYPKFLKCHVCGFSMPRQFMGHEFTEKEIDHLMTHRYTSAIEFVNRRGHEFYDAVVIGMGKGLEFAPMAAKIY